MRRIIINKLITKTSPPLPPSPPQNASPTLAQQCVSASHYPRHEVPHIPSYYQMRVFIFLRCQCVSNS